ASSVHPISGGDQPGRVTTSSAFQGWAFSAIHFRQSRKNLPPILATIVPSGGQVHWPSRRAFIASKPISSDCHADPSSMAACSSDGVIGFSLRAARSRQLRKAGGVHLLHELREDVVGLLVAGVHGVGGDAQAAAVGGAVAVVVGPV